MSKQANELSKTNKAFYVWIPGDLGMKGINKTISKIMYFYCFYKSEIFCGSKKSSYKKKSLK